MEHGGGWVVDGIKNLVDECQIAGVPDLRGGVCSVWKGYGGFSVWKGVLVASVLCPKLHGLICI